MSNRTFTVDSPLMSGLDVKQWQQDVKKHFKKMGINCPIEDDGIYGHGTRSYTAALLYAIGMSPSKQLKDGVTPDLRTRVRENKLTPYQAKMLSSKSRARFRHNLKQKWSVGKVHAPLAKILEDSWGYHPGIHDGEDLICNAAAPTFAMVKCRVIDVRSSGWWGKGAPSDPTLRAKGDGIVQMEVLENVGPFKKGMHIGYGHNENAVVKVGDILKAGDHVAHAGFANAWHIHLMVNDGSHGMSGVGTQDPRPLIDYAVKNG